jgi:hypothetical protein
MVKYIFLINTLHSFLKQINNIAHSKLMRFYSFVKGTHMGIHPSRLLHILNIYAPCVFREYHIRWVINGLCLYQTTFNWHGTTFFRSPPSGYKQSSGLVTPILWYNQMNIITATITTLYHCRDSKLKNNVYPLFQPFNLYLRSLTRYCRLKTHKKTWM